MLHTKSWRLSQLMAFAEGDPGRTEPGVEVVIASEDVDNAHVVLLVQQASLRRAHLDQLEKLSMPVPS